MKHTIALLSLFASLSALAQVKVLQPGSEPRIYDASVRNILESKSHSCDQDEMDEFRSCDQKGEKRAVVTVTVKYIVEQANPIDDLDEVVSSFDTHIDQSDFTSEELQSLSNNNYQARLKAAKALFELKIVRSKRIEYVTPMPVLEVEVLKK
jgi:hypothetical protein